MKLFILLIGFLMLVAVAFAISKTKYPLVTACKSSVSGVACLMLVNVFSKATGCYIAVNGYTAFMASVLSIPGVICLLFMKIIFNY